MVFFLVKISLPKLVKVLIVFQKLLRAAHGCKLGSTPFIRLRTPTALNSSRWRTFANLQYFKKIKDVTNFLYCTVYVAACCEAHKSNQHRSYLLWEELSQHIFIDSLRPLTRSRNKTRYQTLITIILIIQYK